MDKRAVVITGVSSGLGLAIAQHLIAKDVTVFGSVRRAEDAPPGVVPLLLDVTDSAAVQAAASQVAAHPVLAGGQTLAGLVCNAGYSQGPDPLAYMDLDLLRKQLEVNVVAQVGVLQAFLPLLGGDLSRTGAPGRVVFMGSVYGSYATAWNGAYAASKHAMEAIAIAARQELRAYGIKVTLLRPGPIATGIWQGAKGEDRDFHAYDDTDMRPMMASTERYYQGWLADKRSFKQPADVAAVCWKALTAKRPKAYYVVTARRLENWILPRWLPVLGLSHRVDAEIARRFGIRRLPRKSNMVQKAAGPAQQETAPLLKRE